MRSRCLSFVKIRLNYAIKNDQNAFQKNPTTQQSLLVGFVISWVENFKSLKMILNEILPRPSIVQKNRLVFAVTFVLIRAPFCFFINEFLRFEILEVFRKMIFLLYFPPN